MPSFLAGGFALAGGLGGILLSGWLTRRNEERRVADDDARRWLGDRRKIYAAYLVVAESMLRDGDNVGVLLSYDGTDAISEEDEATIQSDLIDYFDRWQNEPKPALLEVQLMATPSVADLAERVSGGLMEITGDIEMRAAFTEYYPGWFQARDLFEVLRNAMRSNLAYPKRLCQPFQGRTTTGLGCPAVLPGTPTDRATRDTNSAAMRKTRLPRGLPTLVLTTRSGAPPAAADLPSQRKRAWASRWRRNDHPKSRGDPRVLSGRTPDQAGAIDHIASLPSSFGAAVRVMVARWRTRRDNCPARTCQLRSRHHRQRGSRVETIRDRFRVRELR